MIICEPCLCDCCGNEHFVELYRMPDLRFRRFSPEYVVVECKECGHRYLNPRPREEDLFQLYPDSYYQDRNAVAHRQAPRYLKQAEIVERYQKGGRLLDVGCAGGGWIKTMQGRGWNCTGTDIVTTSHTEANVDIRAGALPDLDLELEGFDIITAWAVMEHVPAPSRYFARVHKLLCDKGRFIMLVPNGDSLWSRWAYNEDIPRHLHFFRKRTIKRYAKQHAFLIEKIVCSNDIYSRPASGRGLFQRRLLRLAGAPWMEMVTPVKSPTRRWFGRLGAALDYLLIHPWLEERLGMSGNMIVVLRKAG